MLVWKIFVVPYLEHITNRIISYLVYSFDWELDSYFVPEYFPCNPYLLLFCNWLKGFVILHQHKPEKKSISQQTKDMIKDYTLTLNLDALTLISREI